MIPQAALDDYLKAPRDDHRWVKKLTHEQLDEALAALDPAPNLNPKLRLHQKACFLLGVAYPRFSWWLDMGAGKTLLNLELLRYWYEAGRLRRAIVTITSDKAFPTWERQMRQFDTGLPYCSIVSGSSEEKWDKLKGFKEGLIFATYPGMVAMCSTREKGKKGKLRLDRAKINPLAADLDALVLDESTRAGGPSLTNALCARLAGNATACYALAGRPFGRDPTMLWRQQYIVDGGESLGQTLGLFRGAFFTEEKNRWDRTGRARDYTFNKAKTKELGRLMRHRSISYDADECVDLPPLSVLREPVYMPAEADDYYKRAVQSLIEAKGNYRQLKNMFVRMRQMSSGFIGFKDDETGDKAEVEFGTNPKLERLMELLTDLPVNRKALVFYEFTFSGRKIVKELEQLGIGCIWLWSGTKNAGAQMDRFMNDPECTVAVVNHKVGAYSLDGLQVANYLMFYESPVSVIDREQAERRVRRQGQMHKVFQYDLLTKGTLDEKILLFHAEGADIMKALSRDPAWVLTR